MRIKLVHVKITLSLIAVISGTVIGLYIKTGIYKEMFFAIGILGVFCAFASLNESAHNKKSIKSKC
jgi:hypothetical protein